MSKREEVRARRRRDAIMQWLIPGIIVVIGIVILGGIVFYNSRGSVKEVVVPNVMERPNKKDNNMGDPNAPVKVIALEDYQCPYCSIYTNQQEPLIVQKYISTGKVYYTFNAFSFLGTESFAAAESAYCAMDQGKFWEYHDYLYSNQDGENKGGFSTNRLEAIANRMGLDMNAYKTCVSDHKYSQKAKDDRDFASKSGATGSPYFLVNGKLVDVNSLEATIDAALAGK